MDSYVFKALDYFSEVWGTFGNKFSEDVKAAKVGEDQLKLLVPQMERLLFKEEPIEIQP